MTDTRAETPLGARIRTYERKLARACNQYHMLTSRLDELIARRAAAAARDQTNFLYSLTLRTGVLEGVVNVLQLYIEKLCDEIRTLRMAAYLCSLRSSRIQIDDEEEEDDEDYIDDYESDLYGHGDIEDDDITPYDKIIWICNPNGPFQGQYLKWKGRLAIVKMRKCLVAQKRDRKANT